MQVRLQRFSTNVTGTIISAIAIKQGDMGTVQIQAEKDQLVTYISGVRHELVPSDSPVVVSNTAIFSNLADRIGADVGDPSPMMSAEQLFLQMSSEGSLVVSTGEGVSISVALDNGFLGLTTTLPDSFRNMTSGLLGVFNGNPEDDFRDRDGNILHLTAEEEIYEQFGLLCKSVFQCLQSASQIMCSLS